MFQYSARVHEIIDGDTIDVSLDLGFNIQHIIRLRLYGINAPETKTKDLHEKELGLKAKARLSELILSKVVTIKTHKTSDKYGRYLAEIYLDENNINKVLISEGLAKEYFGGKRE